MKKKKPFGLRRYLWYDELYGVTVVLLHGEWKASYEWLDKTFGDVEKDDVGGGDANGKTIMLGRASGESLVLWFPPDFTLRNGVDLSVLAHECFHGADMVLCSRGLVLSNNSDEAYAYYVGWLFRESYMRMKHDKRDTARRGAIKRADTPVTESSDKAVTSAARGRRVHHRGVLDSRRRVVQRGHGRDRRRHTPLP